MVDGCDVNYDLILAVCQGNLERTRELINTFGLSYINSVSTSSLDNGYTPLHFPAEKGRAEVAKILLDRGASVDVREEKGFTPLHIACMNDNLDLIKLLVQYGAKVDNHDKNGKTTLQLAVEHVLFRNAEKRIKTIKYILKCCPDINNPSNKDSLKIAVRRYAESDEHIVEALYNYGLTVNPTDTNDHGFLHTAIKKGYFKIVQDLLKQGADVNKLVCHADLRANLRPWFLGSLVPDTRSFTPLHTAVTYNQEGIANLLISYKANINAQDDAGSTPLHIATANCNKNIVELLLRSGAKPDLRGKDGKIALHYACNYGCIETLATLLEFGSDINITCLNGHTPLYDSMFYIDSEYCKPVAEYLVCHITKMKVANIYVSEKNFLSVNEIKQYMICRGDFDESDFLHQCVRELEKMKNEKVCLCTISFYDILTKGANLLAVSMRNENLVKALKSANYSIEFPLYATIIKSHFRKGMERKELLDLGLGSLYSLFNNLTDLPYGCTEKILSYLSNKDLENLIDVFKSHCIS